MSGDNHNEADQTRPLRVGDEVTFTTSAGTIVKKVEHIDKDGLASFGHFPPGIITHINGKPVGEVSS